MTVQLGKSSSVATASTTISVELEAGFALDEEAFLLLDDAGFALELEAGFALDEDTLTLLDDAGFALELEAGFALDEDTLTLLDCSMMQVSRWSWKQALH